MKARSITLQHFTTHAATIVELPERGLVLVRGANGSGKSSLYEAVAWAGWGETVRGRSPCPARKGTTRAVVETFDGLNIERSRRGQKTSLAWREGGAAPVDFESTTKGQAALEARIGSFERWRRTHVFTLRDPWSFTTASDRDRKLFLERLLGLDALDDALVAVRDDRRSANTRATRAQMQLVEAKARVESFEERVARSRARLGEYSPPVDLDALTATVARLRTLSQQVAADARAANAAWQEARDEEQRRVGEHTAQVRAVTKQIEAMEAGRGVCPTCGQASQQHLNRLRDQLAALERQNPERADLDGLHAALEEVRVEREAVARRLAAAEQQVREAEALASLRATVESDLATDESLLQKAQAWREEVEASVARAVAEVAELDAVEAALGLRGARASLLAATLSGMEAVANAWLARLGRPELRVKIASTSQRTAGGLVDAISVEVEGAADGQGYQGASGGERTRYDLAVMLAIADMAGGIDGADDGTLFFDEVLDTLDAEGVEAVAALLEDIARARPVVVISHAPELVERLATGARLLRVEAGAVIVDRA